MRFMQGIIGRGLLLVITIVMWTNYAHATVKFTAEELSYLRTDSVRQAQLTNFFTSGSAVTRQLWLVADEVIPEHPDKALTFTIVFCQAGESDFDTDWQVFYISDNNKAVYYCKQTLHDGIETIYFRKSHLSAAQKSLDWTIASAVSHLKLDEKDSPYAPLPYVPVGKYGNMLMIACDDSPDLLYSYNELFSSQVQLYRQEHIFEGSSVIITDLDP